MTLGPGVRIGPYEVTAKIGAGGMGEVWRARDLNLGRDVAIKVLPDSLAQDSERLARFEREAKTLAALNHPNIAAVYGFETSDNSRALVMELVEGPTLADRIGRTGVPVPEALGIAHQIIDALDAAHGHGIIHRDLKPANVKVRADGAVKVLDFGLAKTIGKAGGPGGVSDSPTIAARATQYGVILGTAAYMSPEQARGGPVDARTDIWAFGCVLYELVTGLPAFARGTTADTLAAVVDKEPDWSAWPGGVSDSLHRLVARCLMKDPRRRLRDIGDARVILEDTAVPQPVKTSRWPRLAALLVIVLIAVAAGYGVRGLGVGPTPSTSRVTRMTIALEVADWVGLDRPAIALSPNGDSLVYVAREDGRRHLNVRRFDAFEARAIEDSGFAAAPFFDPSGRWIGFVADRTLKKTSLAGGRPIMVTKVADVPLGAAWLPDGSIVLGSINGSGLTRVPAEGGDPQAWPTAPPAGVAEAWPQSLPDGSAVLFTSLAGAGEPWFVDVLAVATGARKRLLEGASAFFVSTGHLVFMRGAAVMAVRFDPNRLEPAGEPVTLIENVQRAASTGAAQLSVSTTGDLVYVPDVDAEPQRLMLVQRDGRATSIAPPARPYVTLRISPNGQRIAASVDSGAGQDIWIYDVPRKAWSQLTFNGGATPIWTRDGTHVTFARRGQIYWKAADGTGPEMMLSATPASPHSWAPDGSALLAVGQDGVLVLPVAARGSLGEPRVYMRGASAPSISPDGRWVAFVSTGPSDQQAQVYVRPFPLRDGQWRVSDDGGTQPAWSTDGRQLFFRKGNRMMAVRVDRGAIFKASAPELLFEGEYRLNAARAQYDVNPDGLSFVMLKSDDSAPATRTLHAVFGWSQELRERLP